MWPAEKEHLWKTGQLGDAILRIIQFTLWFFSTKVFGLRGKNGHRQLKYGYVTLRTTLKGREYMEYAEKESRKPETVKNLLITEVRQPRLYSDGTSRDPVMVCKKFLEKRPEKSEKNNSLFYLSCVPKESIKNEDDSWSYASSMGENCLARTNQR